MTRGILFLAFGSKYIAQAVESARYAREYGLPITLITDNDSRLPDRIFDKVIRSEIRKDSIYAYKGELIPTLTPYDTTLYLDSEAKLVGDPEFAFDKAERHGIAIALAPFYDLDSRDMNLVKKKEGLPQYNCGVMFFNKQIAGHVLKEWSVRCFNEKANCDQIILTQVMHDKHFSPYVLTANWNYRSKWQFLHGNLKVWHTTKPLPERKHYGRPERV